MKTIKFLLAITLFFSFTFSISAQVRSNPTTLDQEPGMPVKPVSNIPDCFCCGDKIYQLQKPTIKGEDLICKDQKNVFNTIGCEGANITWQTAPVGISFTGQGTSTIQIDYSSIPAGTNNIVLIVQIRCGNKMVGTKIQVKVCPPCPQKQIVIADGEDAMLHGLDAIYSVSGLNYRDTNFGNYQSNAVTTWTYGGTPATTYSLIKFNLENLNFPKECITSAKIVFKEHIAPGNGVHSGAYGTAVSQPTNFELRPISSTWSAGSVTWNTKPSTITSTSIPIQPAYSGSGNDDITVNVTTEIQGMIAPGINNGFMFRWPDNSLTNNYRARWFGSFEAPAGKKPVLVIN
jgi:hypothetical protein